MPNENIFFYLYYGEIKLHFDEMMIMTALYLINTLNWILIVPAHWNNSSHVDMSLHFDTFWANQSLFLPLTVENLAEKKQIQILYAFVWPDLSQTHDLPHSRRAPYQLNHRWGCYNSSWITIEYIQLEFYIYIYTHLISILFNIL
jgi:hypothetical protein